MDEMTTAQWFWTWLYFGISLAGLAIVVYVLIRTNKRRKQRAKIQEEDR